MTPLYRFQRSQFTYSIENSRTIGARIVLHAWLQRCIATNAQAVIVRGLSFEPSTILGGKLIPTNTHFLH